LIFVEAPLIVSVGPKQDEPPKVVIDMKSRGQPRFDLDALRKLAGEKAFARGQVYHRDGHVRILALEAARVLARVEGTEDYRTQLTGRGERIGGACTCPAYDDWGFCKHMVAVALAVNAAGDGRPEGADVLERIRDHLKTQGVDALAEMILGVAERDGVLFRKLEMAVVAVGADDKTIMARLRKSIDQATSARGGVDYYGAGDWAEEAAEALGPLDDLLAAGRAGPALTLAEHAIDRIEAALGEIDDSNGECYAVLQRAREIHMAAALAARPDPVALAQDLFEREIDGDYDTFSGAAGLYAEALGEAGLAEYRRLAAEGWEKLPTRGGAVRAVHEVDGDYYRLSEILDFFAERDGDVDARIALRSKDLSSSGRYLQLAQFCLAQGRKEEALRRAEEGLWVFEDGRPDEVLAGFAADLLCEMGRAGEAQALLRRTFEKQPSKGVYARLRAVGGEAARDWAIAVLDRRVAEEGLARWHLPADLLIGILLDEAMIDAAWAVALKHPASMSLRMSLVRASEATHPKEALGVYTERVEALVKGGSNDNYAEAADCVKRMAALRGAAEQTAYLAALKQRHGRKRNFMKLLG
jgi:tetratricopeptide (TPR) repeat protein